MSIWNHNRGPIKERVVVGVEQVKVMVLPGGRGGRVDRKNMAIALGRTAKTMAEWKRLGIGPRQYLVGGRVFADWDEVQAFAAGEKVAR
jgi:hypothetical protein